MDPGSLLLIASASASSAMMIAAAARSRRRRDTRILGTPLTGFKPLEEPSLDYTFHVDSSTLPGMEGEWRCGLLGCGGWGCAYKCAKGQRAAAFKVPNSMEYRAMIESGSSPTMAEPMDLLDKVSREAEAIGRLSHPHLLRLLAHSKIVPLLVYEYADMGTLGKQLTRGWQPSTREVILVGAQLGDAIRYIHSRGLVHGDIKPGNVLVSGGVAKLGDFSSLSSLLSQASITGIQSTPGWRAPEQVYSDLKSLTAERGLENRIDVYQLGNLLLYLATRETLDGEQAPTKRRQEVLRSVRDPGLRRVLEAMLEPSPEDRISSEEAARELARLARGG